MTIIPALSLYITAHQICVGVCLLRKKGSSFLSSDGVFAARQLGPQERLGPDKSKDGGQGAEAGGCLDRHAGSSRESWLTRTIAGHLVTGRNA